VLKWNEKSGPRGADGDRSLIGEVVSRCKKFILNHQSQVLPGSLSTTIHAILVVVGPSALSPFYLQ
jgi:hypothetical protein